MSSLNVGRVLDSVSGKLRKCLSECMNTLGLHFEVTLLGHSSVPTRNDENAFVESTRSNSHIVCGTQCGIQGNIGRRRELVL